MHELYVVLVPYETNTYRFYSMNEFPRYCTNSAVLLSGKIKQGFFEISVHGFLHVCFVVHIFLTSVDVVHF